jgi:hypothetical protein
MYYNAVPIRRQKGIPLLGKRCQYYTRGRLIIVRYLDMEWAYVFPITTKCDPLGLLFRDPRYLSNQCLYTLVIDPGLIQ